MWPHRTVFGLRFQKSDDRSPHGGQGSAEQLYAASHTAGSCAVRSAGHHSTTPRDTTRCAAGHRGPVGRCSPSALFRIRSTHMLRTVLHIQKISAWPSHTITHLFRCVANMFAHTILCTAPICVAHVWRTGSERTPGTWWCRTYCAHLCKLFAQIRAPHMLDSFGAQLRHTSHLIGYVHSPPPPAREPGAHEKGIERSWVWLARRRRQSCPTSRSSSGGRHRSARRPRLLQAGRRRRLAGVRRPRNRERRPVMCLRMKFMQERRRMRHDLSHIGMMWLMQVRRRLQ